MSGNIRHNGEQIGKGVSLSVICYLHAKYGIVNVYILKGAVSVQTARRHQTRLIVF